ncbi:UpxY family transcription antiterminator [Fulvivirga imtechensis]|uniref:UpxY family transcription antiterminator n=1 Tax=Fulvivirga imtechensis TaxID=881893 RepID=UPI0012FA69AE|nr:UpxY family transcription antiterminator [Fulvivirga imtechensis]
MKNCVDITRHWYVIYTYPKAEKKVYMELNRKGVEAFLPLYNKVVQRSDRKKKISVPLFSGYVFVCLHPKEVFQVFGVPGFVRFLSTRGVKDIVPEYEIQTIQKLLDSDPEISNDGFSVGDHVTVKSGPLAGLTGRLVSKPGKKKLIVYLESLMQSVSVKVSPGCVEQVFAHV